VEETTQATTVADDELSGVWAQVLDQTLTTESVEGSQRAFINMSRPVALIDDTLLLAVANDMTRWVIESRYQASICAALSTAFSRQIGLAFRIDPQIGPADPIETDIMADSVTQAPTPSIELQNDESRLNPKYTFENYVKGVKALAASAAEAVAENPGTSYNPLFIWGASGLGKTHLLHAIGNYTRSLYRGSRVRYVSSEEFTNEFINAIRDDKAAEFQRKYRQVDVLLVDDIQFLSGKVQTQEEFFHTFNTLYNANKQIVIASDLPPKDLPAFEARMRSRFNHGFMIDITPPDLETRIAILRKKTLQERLSMPVEVLEYIASKVSTNIRELEGALIRVTAFANLNGQTPDLAMAELILRDLVDEEVTPEVSVSVIMEVIGNFYGFTIEELTGTSRNQQLVTARQMAMALCNELTSLSLPKIGKAFGNRDHTTVMHARDKIKNLISNEKKYFNEYTELRQRVLSHSR
jgi:chromosomal replication initiator protein